MNFQKISPVESSSDLLDQAFRKARIRGQQKNLKGNWLQIVRKKESLKADLVKDTLELKLQQILTNFPDLSILPEFYIKLMKITLDYPRFKKALGAISWAVQRNRALHRDIVGKINREKLRTNIKTFTQQYYGRISSILKQIDPQLKFLETCRKEMRSYPDIKELFTVVIYGFPNVGKTTLLNKLTKTKAVTAPYPFTTTSINAGYLTINGQEIQILDVPGSLARDRLNNIEKQAQLVLDELTDLIIYVFDATESCGYTPEQQQKLRQKLVDRDVLVYLSKEDLLTAKDKSRFRTRHYRPEELKMEIGKRL